MDQIVICGDRYYKKLLTNGLIGILHPLIDKIYCNNKAVPNLKQDTAKKSNEHYQVWLCQFSTLIFNWDIVSQTQLSWD